MSSRILTNEFIAFDDKKVSCDVAGVVINTSNEIKDTTTLCKTAREKTPGLKTSSISMDGFVSYGSGEIDEKLYNSLDKNSFVVTQSDNAGAVGNIAYFMNALTSEYSFKGDIGETFEFSFSAESSGGIFRGKVVENDNVTATGNSASVELSAISSTQKLYIGVHVVNNSGTTPTMDINIESDVDNTFSSPTVLGAVSQIDENTTSFIQEFDVTTTDTFFRLAMTLGGTSPEFDIIVSLAVK